MRGCSQVKPDPSGFERQQHDFRTVCRRALKLLDDLSSLLLAHCAVQTYKTEAVFSVDEGALMPCFGAEAIYLGSVFYLSGV